MLAKQECNLCGKEFIVKCTNGGIEYIEDSCQCESDYSLLMEKYHIFNGC